MQPTLLRRAAPILLALISLIVLTSFPAQAQDETYQPISGVDRVQELVKRIETSGAHIANETRKALLVEGRSIIEQDSQAASGNLPLQRELKTAISKSKQLGEEKARLEANAKRTQQQVDDFNRRLESHRLYVENDLNPRSDALNEAFVKRIATFRAMAAEQFTATTAAQLVKAATAKGQRPPMDAAWNYHQHNRDVAEGLAPEENRCALVLSLTLDLKPRKGEKSLKDVASVIPEVRGADIANRYVRARELSNRLSDDWGKPEEFTGEAAEKALQGRKGVIFFDGGYGIAGDIAHIDLWDGKQGKLADAIPPHFKQASRILFWKTPE